VRHAANFEYIFIGDSMDLTKMDQPQEKLLLKPSEAAGVLKICPRTLWQLTREGRLPCVRIYRSVRYDPKDIAKFIENQKKQDN
jgi:hypothetical protein